MLSDEEKEILNNIKEYMQNDIDKGYHKFVYNDLGSDFKCIDCINAIDNVLNLIEKQSKEIEELKQNIHLKEVYVLKTNDYIKGTNIEDELCNKKWEDKIKAKIEELQDDIKYSANPLSIDNSKFGIKVLQSLLEKE